MESDMFANKTRITLAVLGLALSSSAVAADALCEGFDDGSTAGWIPNTIFSQLALNTEGGNPEGYLVTSATNLSSIGTTTNELAFSDSYEGLREISLDVMLEEGVLGAAAFRVRYRDFTYNGWRFPLVPTSVDQTLMCHCPPGQADRCITMTANAAKLDAHIDRHDDDHLGACEGDGDGSELGEWVPGVWNSFVIAFDPTWTDDEAIAAGWVPDYAYTVSFAETMSDVYHAEVRIDGSPDRVVGIDNICLSN